MKTRGITNAPSTIFMLNQGDADSAYHQLFAVGEKMLPQDLEARGYRLTARHINITAHYKIFELLPLDSSRQANCCFLSPSHRGHGVLIPNTFSEHKAATLATHVRVKRKVSAKLEEAAKTPSDSFTSEPPAQAAIS